MTTKMIDGKGRLMLGPKFARKMVIVEEIADDKIMITKATAIPESEAWLFANKKALAMVRQGLADAAAGNFVPGPDLDELRAFLEETDADSD